MMFPLTKWSARGKDMEVKEGKQEEGRRNYRWTGLREENDQGALWRLERLKEAVDERKKLTQTPKGKTWPVKKKLVPLL